MEENDLTSKVLKGEKVYPYMDGKVVRISICWDLREHYKHILRQENIIKLLKENNYSEITSYLQFNRLLFEDIKFLNIIKTYFEVGKTLISDKDADYMYGVNLITKDERPYTLRLVETYCNLNRLHFFEDYIDIFGNKITFK